MMALIPVCFSEAEPVLQGPLPQKSLYERLGGVTGIEAVVNEFIARGSVNPKVNFSRQGMPRTWSATPENVALLKAHLVQFMASVTGGSEIYEGKDMVTAHAGMKITNAEFDALAGDLKASLDQLQVPSPESDELLSLIESTRSAVVEEV